MMMFQELLSDTRDVISRLLAERLQDVDTLRDEVERYHAHVLSDAGPLTDTQSASTLHSATLALLERTSAAPIRARQLAQVAARYFVMQDDGEDDLQSPYGFDDDVEVFNAVVHALGEPQHQLAY